MDFEVGDKIKDKYLKNDRVFVITKVDERNKCVEFTNLHNDRRISYIASYEDLRSCFVSFYKKQHSNNFKSIKYIPLNQNN